MCSLMCLVMLIMGVIALYVGNDMGSTYIIASALFGIGSSIEILGNKISKR